MEAGVQWDVGGNQKMCIVNRTCSITQDTLTLYRVDKNSSARCKREHNTVEITRFAGQRNGRYYWCAYTWCSVKRQGREVTADGGAQLQYSRST